MLLRLLKGTSPGVLFAIIFIILVVWISAFYNQPVNSTPFDDTESMPLNSLLKLAIGNNHFISTAFSVAVVSLMAYLMVYLNTSVFFINERTFLPAVIYILLGGLFPEYQGLNPAIPASLFLMLAIIKIMDGYRKPGIAYNFFDAGIFISIGSLFYANLIWFGLLVIIGIALLRTGDMTEIAISFLGLLTPYLLTFSLYYVMGKDLRELTSLIENNLFSRTSDYLLSRLTIVTLIYTGIIILVSIFHLFMLLNTKKIKSRQTFYLLTWGLLISIVIYIFLPSVSIEVIWIISIPASYFLTHYFVFAKKKVIPEIFFSVLFILIMLIQIWYLKREII